MSQINIAAVDITLNGHVVEGLSDDADALSMPNIELFQTRRGARGEMVSFRTGNRGGEIMLKLLPSSRTHVFLQRQVARMNNPSDPARVNWEMEINDEFNGVHVHCRNGVLKTAPYGQTLGQGEAANREYTFEFQTIDPQYDQAEYELTSTGGIGALPEFS